MGPKPPPGSVLRMLSMLAHDLRSPLAAVVTNLGYLEASLRRRPRETTDALVDAQLSCRALQHLIANLDVLANIGPPEQTEPTALVDIARSSASRFEPQARSSELSIDVRASADLPRVVAARPSLERALDNMLSNALEHAPSRSIVRVTVERHGDCGAIAVADDGPVVPEDLRDAVLTWEGQAALKKRLDCRYGRGLGLFCAEQAAMAGGGRVTVAERGGRSLLLLLVPFTAAR